MALRKGSLETKNKILSVSAKLFIEQGYHNTTISQIIKLADVSVSSFQNIFKTKDGVLMEFVRIMFGGQFAAARHRAATVPPAYVYALETAIQLAITEQNENLRDIYLEAYSQPLTCEYIYEQTAVELKEIFGANFPGYTDRDFYELEIGSAGVMRGYMSKKCSIHFPLDRKISRFLYLTLKGYGIQQDELDNIIAFVAAADIPRMADDVMQSLFKALQLRFDFTL